MPVTRAIRTDAGHELTAQLFHPDAAATGAVLIVPAMGVTQSFYAPLATWLAAQGFLTATFDYQGMGGSRHGRLRDVRADILDWARSDCAAMIDVLVAELPDRPLFWIGHSLGAQILPFVPNHHRVAKIVTVAAGSGYWRENAPSLRRRAWLLWYVIAPVALPIAGYFPGKRLRMVGDVPRPVMAQWRRWCLDPQYVVGVEGEVARSKFAAVETPMLSLSFTDDEFMSARNVESLHGFFARAPKVMLRIDPRDVGEQRIGHFGFFRVGHDASLWERYLLPALK